MITFELPNNLIAQTPASPRDAARLLVYNRATKKITDAAFSDVGQYLSKESTLAVNNSKVEQCRWLFDGDKIELFILEKLDMHTVRALVRPGKKFKIGSILYINDWLQVTSLAADTDGIRTVRLSVPHDDPRLNAFEHIPLPPYIAQDDTLKDEYQTVYADPLGSKAAPTAGLHFTDALLTKIRQDHMVAELTLHVSLGTFAKLTDAQLASGHLHSERYEISPAAANILNKSTRITAVGTTSVRVLESAIRADETYIPVKNATSILIQPGYQFKKVNSLITNFHLPGTSLLLLVEAFVGSQDELQKIYDHAIAQKYRFYSFGDAMLIL